MKTKRLPRLIVRCCVGGAIWLALPGCSSGPHPERLNGPIRAPGEQSLLLTRITSAEDEVRAPSIDNTRPKVDGDTLCGLGPRSYRAFDVSPDGRNLAYVGTHRGRRDAFIRNLAPSGRRAQLSFTGHVDDIAFSPDSRSLVVSDYYNGAWTIRVISADSTGPGTVLVADSAGQVSYPSFAPRGAMVLLERTSYRSDSVNTTNERSSWLYDLHSRVLSRQTSGGQPSFTPDGRRLIVVRARADRMAELWVTTLAGDSAVPVLQSRRRGYLQPAVSPDGSRVAFTSRSGDCGSSPAPNLDIYVARIDGGDVRQLTFHPGHDLYPHWSPDGHFIYFMSARSGYWAVWRLAVPRP